jgi:hypothetical protein
MIPETFASTALWPMLASRTPVVYGFRLSRRVFCWREPVYLGEQSRTDSRWRNGVSFAEAACTEYHIGREFLE